MYGLAIIAALSFAGGFGLSYEIYSGEIIALHAAIDAQENQANMMLDIASKRAVEAQKRAIETNKQLDAAHDSSIKTINTYHDMLASAKLSISRRKSCTNSMPRGGSTSVVNGEAGIHTVPEGFDRFIKERFYQADRIRSYAETCYSFVANECGIKKVIQ